MDNPLSVPFSLKIHTPWGDDMTQTKKSLFGAQDMTRGSALRNIIAFSIPLLIGNIFQQLYNTVDALVVGNAAGSNALAAVGASGQVIFFFVSLFIGISTGAGVLISQAFGAHDQDRLRRTVSTMYALTLYVGIFLSVAGFLLAGPILRLLQTPEEIMQDSIAYLRIIFVGMLVSAAYNTIGGVLRAVGDSITPLIFLVVATVVNIALDLLFVLSFGWGVMGVALATIIAQGISAILSIIRVNRMGDALRLNFKSMKIDREILPGILRIGLPSGIQQISISLGSMAIQGLVNSLGVAVVAGNTAFGRIDTFTSMPMMTISMAITTYVGQNIGARRIDRVERGIKISIVLVLIVAALMSSISIVFAEQLLGLFVPGEHNVIAAGLDIVYRITPFYFLLGIMFCMSGVMRGAGEARVPMITSIMSVVVVRVPLAYLLYNIFGTAASIWWAVSIGWALGCLVQFFYYRFADWRGRALRSMQAVPTMPDDDTEFEREA
jgi:putative MATE family efflux protein